MLFFLSRDEILQYEPLIPIFFSVWLPLLIVGVVAGLTLKDAQKQVQSDQTWSGLVEAQC